MDTPVSTLMAISELGGRVYVDGDALKVSIPSGIPERLRGAIRLHKPDLIHLLSLRWVIVRSEALNCVVIWVPDDDVRSELVHGGAESFQIYDKAELDELCKQGRTGDILKQLHALRRVFDGHIVKNEDE